jgi:hypothetical protein
MAVRLVQLTNYRFIHEAEAAKMFLEEAGIPAVIEDAETVTMDWLLGNAIGYIKVKVPEDRWEEAARILSTRQRPAEPSPDETDELHCLACGAELDDADKACAWCGWTWAETRSPPRPTREEE